MFVLSFLTWLVSLMPFIEPVAASGSITADNHSFGGVNYPLLQFFTPQYRDETIRAIVKSKARVIRLFIRPDELHADPESELGVFDKSLLDQFDDLLAAIHRISKGQVKVIIAPHDSHALRGSKEIPCDAYCKRINGAFLDFYSNEEIRELYKTRLEVFFKHYPSKNFDGRPWGTLSEVILGVDLQNQPFSGIWPIPSGEYWLCEIAEHLKFNTGLGNSSIAVISGGISGPQQMDGIENFPDSAFKCPGIDVIGIHGYYKQGENTTAGTPWANMFVLGNTLTARSLKKGGQGKLLLVEEWEYVHSASGLDHKNESIFDQGTALNLRGIPWLYSHLSPKDENTTTRINPFRSTTHAFTTLSDLLSNAHTSRSPQNWTVYLPPPASPLTNLISLPLNPHIPSSRPCAFRCPGFLCDAPDACAPDLICKNSVCQRNAPEQPGQIGAQCTTDERCQSHLRCEAGTCAACSARASVPAPGGGERAANDPAGTCYANSPSPVPVCLGPDAERKNPCDEAVHCEAGEFCAEGSCVPCDAGDACLGAPCSESDGCLTGLCNTYGSCDYSGQRKIAVGPGAWVKKKGARGR